jgi:surface polysaccharide O-acyltransferase-like enzyme
MKSTTSISFTAGFFMYFLFVSYYNHAEDIYTPLKQSIIEGNISMAAMFGLDLLAILTIAICIILVIKNISNRRFFTKRNFICFYIMGIAFYFPVFDYAIIGRFICQVDVNIDFALYLAAGSFMLLLAEIFRYGYRLKEEQDLTI